MSDRVDVALVERLVGVSAIPLLGVALGTVLVATMHWTPAKAPILAGWVALVYAAVAARVWLTLRIRRSLAEGGCTPATGRRYALTTFISGLAWGLGGLLVINGDPLAVAVTVTSFQAMVMGSVVTLGAYLPAFFAFAVPAMMPMVLGLAWMGDFGGWVMTAYSFIFFLLMFGIAVRYHRSLKRALELTFEKEDLIAALTAAHRQAAAGAEAKAQFLATMSHEIRTPMNGIIGLVRLMLDRRLDATLRDLADTIRQSAESLLAILDDILDVSKLDAGKLTIEAVAFDPRRMVEGVVQLMRSRAVEKGLDLDIRVAADVPAFVKSDPTRLRQIILNLVGNAIKFTENGGVAVEVAVSVGATPRLEFSVVDTGIGIPEAARAELFAEFFQVDGSIARRFGGTGLGLAICRRLVTLMGGAITVDSVPGRGSTFRIEVPLVPAVAADVAADQADAAVPLPPLRVLLAEDNVVNQKVALGLLGKHGHHVTVVRDGTEAVAAVQAARFDVVLMDMQMPNMDGLEATCRIRALPGPEANIPIIAMTANALKGDDERCLAAGMNGYVPKPVNPARLFVALRRHLHGVPVSAPGALVDRDVLAPLAAEMGGSGIIEMVALFAEEARQSQAAILAAADGEAMQAAAEELKAMAGNVGATGLHDLAEAIELACRENRFAEARSLAEKLDDCFARSLRGLNDAVAALDQRVVA